ncbi:hypothetical protein M422DRAFT_255007 [Sphaerobolus stellatus SS14]|uniref:AB hydrolase-1 domain-containing protein n=1 Tax=Sphaerobolus stellatus (strain SS14) TaxID=990650 RepID=A0A0C9VUQ4_SPHS4|nr:hypothetical protein M422DRAFT_255007 [Sphaerobolus stellatus SS14]
MFTIIIPILALSITFRLLFVNAFSVTALDACSCSSGFIVVGIDAEVAVDPSVKKPLNSTALRRQKTTFNIFGKLCQPVMHNTKESLNVQLLLHGITYTKQYWDVQWNNFQNYSYMEYSCSHGVSSFAYDDVCAGQSTKPANSQECQLPTAAAVASSLAHQLKDGSIGTKLTGNPIPFQKVFGIGHSMGSVVLNYGAILEGRESPFTGLIFTGKLSSLRKFQRPDSLYLLIGLGHSLLGLDTINSIADSLPTASSVDPARWGDLDTGYITTLDVDQRTMFYGPPGTFDTNILQLDSLTKDVSTVWMLIQSVTGNINNPTQFHGPVTTIDGALDAISGCPCNETTFPVTEKAFFPDANYTAILIPGQGHDLNLEFGAKDVFPIMLDLFRKATD